MLALSLVLYALIGTLAGFLAGLLGIGGGLVTVPILLLTFSLLDFSPDTKIQMAVGTSLGAMVFTAASSAYAHYAKKGVRKDIFYLLAPGIIFGAAFGAFVAIYLSSPALKLIIATSEILIGLSFFSPHSIEIKGKPTFHPLYFGLLGFPIGAFSTVLGIGGGLLTVPILTFFRVPLHQAISTSAATGFLIALIGAISFLFPGLWLSGEKGGMGYLYPPAFIIIGLTSSLCAPYGAQLAYRLPTSILKRTFGAVLIIVGIILFCSF